MYEEFRKRVIRGNEHHTFEVTNSNGTKEAWRWLKKNRWLDLGQPVTEREFVIIIKTINLHLRDQLIQGKDIDLPHRMGRIEIRRFEAKLEFKDGKLITNLPVDWKRTLELWYEDESAKESKTLIRQENRTRYSIHYDRTKALYNNKAFYQFIPNRDVKVGLKENIINGGLDAFLLQRKNELH